MIKEWRGKTVLGIVNTLLATLTGYVIVLEIEIDSRKIIKVYLDKASNHEVVEE